MRGIQAITYSPVVMRMVKVTFNSRLLWWQGSKLTRGLAWGIVGFRARESCPESVELDWRLGLGMINVTFISCSLSLWWRGSRLTRGFARGLAMGLAWLRVRESCPELVDLDWRGELGLTRGLNCLQYWVFCPEELVELVDGTCWTWTLWIRLTCWYVIWRILRLIPTTYNTGPMVRRKTPIM